MTFYHESQSTQTFDLNYQNESRIHNSSRIYNQRQDVQQIRKKLYEFVPDDEYWETLSSFIFGLCSKERFAEVMNLYLETNEARNLHNDLIRAILFNAHYSVTPPPGITVSRKPKNEQHRQNIICKHLKPNYSKSMHVADIRCIPAIGNLTEIIKNILSKAKNKDLIIDPNCSNLIYQKLVAYVTNILKKAISLSVRDFKKYEDINITPEQISHVLINDEITEKVISPRVLAKFSMISNFRELD
ncbi:hypothetical protein TRFO_38534 [Tritrichomonas foetus]|uniref:Uncharacterized protein n=1 Tax=Tritrichomonas foetus TaxID=1144522 RepID=A0A1J4J9K3_9EUKA|nr:hypothetical protein TRFO_38534 [Tritrichomonas foetus]|eukprot:OHS95345.1 hypothetical protein TRFO_38534 [Tritrichomonas foetus]